MTQGEKEKLIKILSDPILFIESFMQIVNKDGKRVPFKLNDEQCHFIEHMDNRSVICKARQLGFTSLACALSLFYAITEKDVHCMMVSYSLDGVGSCFDKLKSLYVSIPDAIKPKEISNNRSSLKFANGSKITVSTFGTKDIGRGSTLRFCHLSELAFCKDDVVDKQLLSVMQAMTPNSTLIIESTANGLNSFYDLYQRAEQGDNLYTSFFYPWHKTKMYENEQKEYAQRYKGIYGKSLTEQELEEDERILLKDGCTFEGLMWRRLKINSSSINQFHQEFPSSSIECFVNSGCNIFNVEKVQQLYNERKTIEKITNIPDIPVELKLYLNNYFTVWETPQKGNKYYVGVDSAEMNADYTVIDVLKEDGMEVAQFRTNKIQAYEMASITNSIGLWYNRALLVVEKASTGGVILDRLRNTFHYKNLYKHKDYDHKGKMVKKIGWITSAKTKPILINDLVEWFENNDIFVRSTATLSEMKTYMFDGSSTNAESGKHDDTIIATACALQGIKSGVNYLWI